MSRVVIVSALPPDARGTGKAVMWGGLWRHVARNYGADATTYVYVGSRPCAVAESDCVVRWVRGPSAVEQARSVVRLSMLRGRPFQEAALNSSRLRREIRREVARCRPDVVLVDTYRLGVLLGGDRTFRLVTYMDDLFSLRYERMRAVLRDRPGVALDPLGNFGAHLPGPVRSLVAIPPVRDWLLASEERRVRRTELEAVEVCDLVLLISPEEVKTLRAWTGSDRVSTVPPLVDAGTPLPRAPDVACPRFVFLGAMNVPHNDVGLVTFLEEAFGKLLERCPGARLDVVGLGVGERLRSVAERCGDRVRFLGFVPDLESVLSTATAMLVPLVFGSGVKIKVIEALGRGLPVVATSFGAEGVARSDEGDDGLRVADDWEQFIAAAAELTEAVANRTASEAARRHYLTYYAPDVVRARYDAVLQ